MQPCLYSSHWSPISLVPQSNPFYPILIGPPIVTLVIKFSLVPHLIGPPMQPWLYGSYCSPISLVPQSNPFHPVPIGRPSHWSPISLVPQCDLGYTVLIGPPCHWSTNVTLITQFSLVHHLIDPQCNPANPALIGSPVSLVTCVPHCNPFYSVLIVPPSHWSPNATLSISFSLLHVYKHRSNCSHDW